MITEPGIYADIPDHVYHADALCPEPSLSCSTGITLLQRSPLHAHAEHPRLGKSEDEEEEDDKKFDMGTAVHELMLCGEERFVVVDAKSWASKDAKAERAAAKAEHMLPLLAHQYNKVLEVGDAVREQLWANPALRGILAPEHPRETTAIWREGESWCRCRPDLMTPDCWYDLKFTGALATPEGWASRTAFDMQYDTRAAWYMRGGAAATGQQPSYRFVVIENKRPYALSWFACDMEAIEQGERKVEMFISIWQRCMKRGAWPGYSQDLQWISPPTWSAFKSEALNSRAEHETLRSLTPPDMFTRATDDHPIDPRYFGI